MRSHFLFVYGTLLKDLAHPMAKVLARGAAFAGAATMRGRLYEVRGYPGVVTSRGPGDRVMGELYRLKNPARTFAVLDDYEMCSDRFPEPRGYRRDVVTVTAEDGTRVRSWVYLYNHSTARLRRIASGDYRDTMAGSGRSSRGGATGG